MLKGSSQKRGSRWADKAFSRVPIEAVRDYWNERPCNIRHSTEELGTRQYFDEVEARKYLVEPHIPELAEFDRWRGKRVLEIGCGIGTDTMNFARAGAEVTAVDLSEESLAMARKRAAVMGLEDRVRFYQANVEELSKTVPIEEYDLVYSFGVIHHTPHPERALAEIRRYMGTDSTLKIMVYNRNSWKVLWIVLGLGKGAFWKADELIAQHSEAQTGCPVTYSYSKSTVCELLRGFDIESSWVDHVFPYVIKDYVRYEYRRVWYFRWMPEELFRRFEKTFGWHLCVTAKPSL